MSEETTPTPEDFREAAAVQYAMFEAYLKAGFSEEQAIKILCGLLKANMPMAVPLNGKAGE